MSTLIRVMALCGAPAHAPAGVSSEVKEPLLPGGWEGAYFCGGRDHGCMVRPEHRGIDLIGCGLWAAPGEPWDLRDQGGGRVRLEWSGRTYLGIYRRRGGRVEICLKPAAEGRPISFQQGKGQILFILYRE